MIREFADEKFSDWLLAETARSRDRVHELRQTYPSAQLRELAQRLIDHKKRWAATSGAVSGLFGLVTLPADLALVAYLQMSVIVDVATLCDRNLKSDRAREELIEVFTYATSSGNAASRLGPKTVSRLGQRLLAAKGMRLFSKILPLVAAPMTAVLNNRDIQLAGDAAIRHYSVIPRALEARRLRG